MENTAYTGLSRQQALQTRMQMISNNIANATTPGYKAQNMVFREFLSQPARNQAGLSMVLNYGQFQDTRPGSIRQTHNPLDIALNGPGFFAVQGPDNQTAYTKGGNLHLKTDGSLVTSAGYAVQGEGGTALSLPPDAKGLKIARDGTISSDDGPIGRIQIVEFDDQQALRPIGDALYVADTQPRQEVKETALVQGALEDSNVNPVLEMTRMIEVSRSYQSTARMLQTEHDRVRGMIRALTSSN